jgi:hypothetical protein
LAGTTSQLRPTAAWLFGCLKMSAPSAIVKL